MLQAVASLPEAQLARGLDELTASGLLARRGVPPDASYVFKHALVRDAAYESLLESRRAEVHAAIVAASEAAGGEGIEPGVLAQHCAGAGLIAKAAFYYRLAAKRSIEQAAAVETRMQLERGLTFATSLPAGPDRDQLEAELRLAEAEILQVTTSMSNAQAGRVLDRALPACRRVGHPELLSRAMWGRFVWTLVRGEVAAAHAIGEEMLARAETCTDVNMQVAARVAKGIALFYQGRFRAARDHFITLDRVLACDAPQAKVDWHTTTGGLAFHA
jgi:predicted ATPase